MSAIRIVRCVWGVSGWRGEEQGGVCRSCRARSVTRAAVTCDDASSQRVLRNISIPAAAIDRRSPDAHHYKSVSRANLILDFYRTSRVCCVFILFLFRDRPWIFRLTLWFSVELRGRFYLLFFISLCVINKVRWENKTGSIALNRFS